MIKFMILFRQPTDPDSFENVFQDFLALIERMPNILRRQVVHVTGGPKGLPQYYRILELYFESPATQQEALLSPIGQEAGKELSRLADDATELMFADVYEEEGGSTPNQPDATPASEDDHNSSDTPDTPDTESDEDEISESAPDAESDEDDLGIDP